MGTINVYKGIGKEYKTFRTNGNLKDALSAFAPEINTAHCIFLKGGESVGLDYQIKDNDIIFARETPGATVCAVIAIITAAVAIGFSIYGAVERKKAQEEAEKAERESKALAESPESLPFLKGAKNKNALGYNIPFIMGSMYTAPYKITSGYYSIGGTNGDTQYWNIALVVGYKNCVINNLSIGTRILAGYNTSIDVPKADGTKEKVYYMKPNTSVLDNLNQYYYHSGAYYAKGNKIQIVDKAGDMEVLQNKITSTSYGEEIPHKHGDTSQYLEGITKDLEQNTYRADICIMFNGLRRYDDGWKSKNVDVEIQWCNNMADPNPAWKTAQTLSTGEINANKTVRFQTSIIFSAAECFGKDISVRLVRKTEEDETNSQETCYLCYINCWQYDAVKSTASNLVPATPIEDPWNERTLRIGLTVLCNDSTKDTLDEINCMAYGTARIWNGEKWTETRYPTRNPAAWILEILTTEIHPHSKYRDDEIDLESLGALYEYCEKEQFFCDGIVTKDTKKSDLLNQILDECFATMYRNADGQWTFAIEQKQEIPVALLNEQSIKSVSVAKTFARSSYAQKVTYTERSTWNINTLYINEANETNSAALYRAGKTISETALNYITTGNQAMKYARRANARQKLQPREIIVNVGHEGDYYPLYSKILLQMKQMKIGLSGGIIHSAITENGLLSQIKVSDLCDFSDKTKKYGLIIQAQNGTDSRLLYLKVKGTGKTRILTLASPAHCEIIPEYGNIYSFGFLDSNGKFTSVTNQMTIYSAKQNSSGWELTLKDYNDALFDYGAIPEYKTNLTTRKESGTKIPALTYGDVKAAVTEAKAEITSTIDINKYTLDISPEAQGVPSSNDGKLGSSWLYISAYLYYMDKQITDNITYKAYLSSGDEVGQWDGNKVKISTGFLKGDVLYITIKVIYKIDDLNIVEREVQAQISRLYGADSTKIYKMLFPDGEKVKVDKTGEIIEPEQLRAVKRVASGKSENNTDFGHITLETLPSGNEETYSGYSQVEKSETFSAKKTYYHATVPFLVKAGDNAVIGDGDKSGALFFMEKLK